MNLETGIPLPKRARRADAKYPFADMNVGDSFFVKGAKVSTLRSSAAAFRRKNPGTQFIVRNDTRQRAGEMETGVRVWRVALTS